MLTGFFLFYMSRAISTLRQKQSSPTLEGIHLTWCILSVLKYTWLGGHHRTGWYRQFGILFVRKEKVQYLSNYFQTWLYIRNVWVIVFKYWMAWRAYMHSHVRLSATLWTVAWQAPLFMGFQVRILGVGYHILLQGIFSTQGLDPHLLCLLHCSRILYILNHQGSPLKTES